MLNMAIIILLLCEKSLSNIFVLVWKFILNELSATRGRKRKNECSPEICFFLVPSTQNTTNKGRCLDFGWVTISMPRELESTSFPSRPAIVIKSPKLWSGFRIHSVTVSATWNTSHPDPCEFTTRDSIVCHLSSAFSNTTWDSCIWK